MKRTTKRPDGSEETVEGSPDEIVEYDRQVTEGRPAPKKKSGVLHGSAEVDEEYVKMFLDAWDKWLEDAAAYPTTLDGKMYC